MGVAGPLTIRPARPWASIRGSWTAIVGLWLGLVAALGTFREGQRLAWAGASLCLLMGAGLVPVLRRFQVRYTFLPGHLVWHRALRPPLRLPYAGIRTIRFLRHEPRDYDCWDQAHVRLLDGSWRVLAFRGFSCTDAHDIVKAISERSGSKVTQEEIGLVRHRGGAYYT